MMKFEIPEDGSIPAFLLRSEAELKAMREKHATERVSGADHVPVLHSGISSPKRRRRKGGPHSEQDPRNVPRTTVAPLQK